jgi:Protein of unknown function (DUF669)
MNERKKLSDILRGSARETLTNQWKNTEAAKELGPLPPGQYVFRILSGELFTAKQGTPGYKLTLEVVEGEHEGRRCWHEVWLTQAALPMAKRDLGKIGVTDLEQLERPLPSGILIRAKIALRQNDDGTEHNRVIRFEFAGAEPGDAFEPLPENDGKGESEPSPFGANGPTRNSVTPGPYDRSERR